MSLTLDSIRTIVRKAFDPETISVTVGRIHATEKRVRVIIRDEISKLEHIFHVSVNHTEDELKALIEEAGAKLGLVKGPDKIGDMVVDKEPEA